MSKTKRLLSLLISTAMVVSCLSGLTLTGFAAGEYVNLTFSESDYIADTTIIKQDKALVSVDVGDITYSVGGRGSGGDAAGFYTKAENDNQYIQVAAGRFSDAGRNAYLVMNSVPETLSENYILSFDVRFAATNSNFILKTESGTEIVDLRAANLNAEVGVWYNYSYIISDGSYCQMLTDADGRVVHLSTGTASESVIRRIDFVDEAGSITIDIDNLYAASDDELICEVMMFVMDDMDDPVPGAVISLGDVEFTADEEGAVSFFIKHGYYLCDITADGYVPATDFEIDTTAEDMYDVYLEPLTENPPASITISGGSDTIYKPASGSNTSDAFVATVYNEYGAELDNETVEWSIEGDPTGASITDGVVTVTNELEVADDDGIDLTIVAASSTDSSVSATATIHINNVARLDSFDIVGNVAIKNGFTGTYSITNTKDQYGAEFTTDETPVFTADNAEVTFDGSTATANITDLADVQTVKISAVISEVTSTFTVNVHNYDFYEPGTGYTSQDVRVINVNGVDTIAWPDSSDSTTNSYIIFDEPVQLTAGCSKEITFEQMWYNKGVYSQYRKLSFMNGTSDTLFELDYTGGTSAMNMGYGGVNGSNSEGYTVANAIGAMSSSGTYDSVSIIFKVLSDNSKKAIVTYNGTVVTVDLDSELTAIDRICLHAYKGIPDDRTQFIKNIIIKDAATTGVSVSGPSYVTKQVGKTATAQFTPDVTIETEGESFLWSVSGDDTTGITIDENGLLSVAETAAAGEITVTVTSDLDDSKTDTVTVTINDFAAVAGFTINGSAAIAPNSSYTYSVSDITDEYGDSVTGAPISFAVTEGSASITADGILTTTSETGTVTIEVAVGNDGYELVKTLDVIVGNYYYLNNNVTDTSVTVDVSGLVGSSVATAYKVTLLKGSEVVESEKTPTNGSLIIDTTGATKLEVSPIFRLNLTNSAIDGYTTINSLYSAETGVGFMTSVPTASAAGVSLDNGIAIALADGFYDISIKKGNGNRTDFMLNGYMIGNNVDQYGYGRSSSGALYELDGLKVEGGTALIQTSGYSSTGNITSYIEVSRKADFAKRRVHIFIGGDSTVTSYYEINDAVDAQTVPYDADSNKQTGWSQTLGNYLTDDVVLVDLAEGGNYAESWITSAFPGVLAQAQPGDYFFVQFGINDRNYGSKSVEGMRTALESMVDQCVAAGIIPVLISPQNSVSLWGTGDAPNGSGNAGYYDGVITSAKNKGALYIDLDSLSSEVLGGYGKDYTNANFHTYKSDGSKDSLHLSYQYASLCASLIAQSIYDQTAADVTDAQDNGFDAIPVNTGYSYSFVDSNGDTQTFRVTKTVYKLNVSTPIVDSTDVMVDIENNTTVSLSASVIVATYDEDGRVIEVAYGDSMTFNAGDSDTLFATIPDGVYDSYKVFVWDSVSGMIPLI